MDLGKRGVIPSSCCAVTKQLICAYALSRFSHYAAHNIQKRLILSMYNGHFDQIDRMGRLILVSVGRHGGFVYFVNRPSITGAYIGISVIGIHLRAKKKQNMLQF